MMSSCHHHQMQHNKHQEGKTGPVQGFYLLLGSCCFLRLWVSVKHNCDSNSCVNKHFNSICFRTGLCFVDSIFIPVTLSTSYGIYVLIQVG